MNNVSGIKNCPNSVKVAAVAGGVAFAISVFVLLFFKGAAGYAAPATALLGAGLLAYAAHTFTAHTQGTSNASKLIPFLVVATLFAVGAQLSFLFLYQHSMNAAVGMSGTLGALALGTALTTALREDPLPRDQAFDRYFLALQDGTPEEVARLKEEYPDFEKRIHPAARFLAGSQATVQQKNWAFHSLLEGEELSENRLKVLATIIHSHPHFTARQIQSAFSHCTLTVAAQLLERFPQFAFVAPPHNEGVKCLMKAVQDAVGENEGIFDSLVDFVKFNSELKDFPLCQAVKSAVDDAHKIHLKEAFELAKEEGDVDDALNFLKELPSLCLTPLPPPSTNALQVLRKKMIHMREELLVDALALLDSKGAQEWERIRDLIDKNGELVHQMTPQEQETQFQAFIEKVNSADNSELFSIINRAKETLMMKLLFIKKLSPEAQPRAAVETARGKILNSLRSNGKLEEWQSYYNLLPVGEAELP